MAGAIYGPPPEAVEGFDHEDFEGDPIEVWPENMPAVGFMVEYCSTQWRIGMNGPTGLDHTAVLADIKTLRLKRAEADQLYADIRVMERSALEAMRKK